MNSLVNKLIVAGERLCMNPIRRLVEPLVGKTKVYSYKGYKLAYERFGVRRHKMRDPDWRYEPAVTDIIVKRLKEAGKPTFIDIGSHIGFISLNILKEVPSVQIFAFEPGTRQRELFEETIKLNKIEDRVALNSYALGQKSGTLDFICQKKWPEADYSMGNGFVDTRRWTKTTSCKVQVETLDNWWNSVGNIQVDAIKIDTEGAELYVLKGGQTLISALKPLIVLEIQPLNLRAYPYDPEDIFDWLCANSYTLHDMDGHIVHRSTIGEAAIVNEMFVAVSKLENNG